MSADRASRERGPKRSTEATASVLLVRALVMGAATLGLSPEQVGEGTGAPARLFALDALGDPDARVPASLVLALWRYLPTRCPDESFGVWLSERLNAPPLSVAFWLISSGPRGPRSQGARCRPRALWFFSGEHRPTRWSVARAVIPIHDGRQEPQIVGRARMSVQANAASSETASSRPTKLLSFPSQC